MQHGLMTLALTQTWPQWVHRRVDHISFNELTSVAVRASLDFTLPEETYATGEQPDGTKTVYVPLSLLLKKRITRFSLSDETGRALPVLTQPKTAAVAAATLWAQAQLVRRETPASIAPPELIPERIEQAFREIASHRREGALKVRRWLVEDAERTDECDACFEWRRALRHSARFGALSRKFAGSYLLITPMPISEARGRRVLKLNYETLRLLGGARQGAFRESPEGAFVKGMTARLRQLGTMSSLRSYPVYFRTGVVGRSRCYHQEAEVPEGLQLTAARMGIYDSSDDTRQGTPDISFGKLQRAHLHVAEVPPNTYGVTQLLVRARINNIARTAWLASALSLALLIAATLVAIILPSALTGIIALLLVPPAALSAFIARPTEPLVSSEVLFGLRLSAAISSMIAFCGAGVAAVGKKCATSVVPAPRAAHAISSACTTRVSALIVLFALVGLSAAVFAVHALIRRNINQPPEHQHFRELQELYWEQVV